MYFNYHRLITKEALAEQFAPNALAVIIKANMRKDDVISNIRNPEHHFTENRIEAALGYIELQRERVVSTLQNETDVGPAWQAFGRLLHTAQDFYAHSNYVSLWVEQFEGQMPPPGEIEALDPVLLDSARLHTARTYRPLGTLGNLPGVGRWLFPFLPDDAHAKMNLDSVSKGPLFVYAFAAAVKRTRYEFSAVREAIQHSSEPDSFPRFTGHR
jgi:hypothetical protein